MERVKWDQSKCEWHRLVAGQRYIKYDFDGLCGLDNVLSGNYSIWFKGIEKQWWFKSKNDWVSCRWLLLVLDVVNVQLGILF
nr:hypothetical protein [Tanacetum cinerariifolium]